MFKTTCLYHEANDDGTFGGYNDPHIYSINTDNEPTAEELDNIFWQMVEIECIEDGQLVLVEQLTEKDDEYKDYDQAVVKVNVKRTDEPSSYIIWGNKIPNIFKIDRSNSFYNIESQKL